MEIASLITAVKESVNQVQKVQKIAQNLKNAELKSAIADLAIKLADANIQLADLKSEMQRLKDENAALQGRNQSPTPKMQWGCYVFENDDRLYCPACYDTKGKKHVTTRLNPRERRRSVCQTVLGS